MAQQVEEHKRLVERWMDADFQAKPIRMDEFIDHLRRQVSIVREEDPTLADYHLHDIKLLFQKQGVILQIDFRK
ncbi:hypothetical protein [Effusibacillus pohliae]|uniref:hypothetical protein n=1 Tax=Effusibacillus pohliae TaxID=232270 RepID=UPI0003780573|nr:hypothetical protein [Effusibacillus pohliae]